MKTEKVTLYICDVCGAKFRNKNEARSHEQDCTIYQSLKNKIVVREALPKEEPIIKKWLKKIASISSIFDQKDISIIDRSSLQEKFEYFAPNLPPNSDIIPLSHLIDQLNYAFNKKKEKGIMLALYKVYIAILDGKIIGASLEDHGIDFENENYDKLIFVLTNREAEDTIRRAAFDALLENYSKIVKERKEDW